MLIFFQHIRAGNVGRHQVGGELNPLEAHIENAGQGADHKCFGETWHPFEQAMAAGENGGEHLFDDFVLPDNHFLQFLLHNVAMLRKLGENFAQRALRLGIRRRRRHKSQRLERENGKGSTMNFQVRNSY